MFNLNERRVLGLPLSGNIDDTPEAAMLRKIMDAFSWMGIAIDCDFDPYVNSCCLQLSIAQMNLNQAVINFTRQRDAKKTAEK